MGKIVVSGEDLILSLSFINSVDLLLLLEKRVSNKYSQVIFIENGTIPKGYNVYDNNCTFISPIYTFPWRETKLFTRQIKVQMGKSTLTILFIKGIDADSGGK